MALIFLSKEVITIIDTASAINLVSEYYDQLTDESQYKFMIKSDLIEYMGYVNYACDSILQELLSRPNDDPEEILFEYVLKVNYYISLAQIHLHAIPYYLFVTRDISNTLHLAIKQLA